MTSTATVDTLSRTVPEDVRGEALGWHGSALTAGSAIGAPLAGVAIDHWDWPAGFVLPALASLMAASALIAVSAVTARRSAREVEVATLVRADI